MRRSFVYILIIFNLVAIPALFYLTKKNERPPAPKELPVLGVLRDFSLKNADNANFRLKDLKGKVRVANFMFTTCPNVCPAMNTKMSALQQALPQSVGLVSFSVNPFKDTPSVLKNYAKKYGAKQGRWEFLTGEKKEIDRVLEDAHLNRSEDPNLHSTRLLLLDTQAQIRGYYDSTEAAAIHNLEKDAAALAVKEDVR